MTGQNFVQVISGNPLLNGSIVSTPPYVLGMGQPSALNCVNATPQNPQITAQNAVPLDRIVFDLALTAIPPGVGTTFATFGKYVGGFAKNGACLINLTGTTAVSIDLTALGTFTGLTSQSGDTSLATVNCLIFNNLGTLAVTIAPGATNPARLPTFTGTTPTISLPAQGAVCFWDVNGQAVDATHKVITITPTAGGSIALSYGGA